MLRRTKFFRPATPQDLVVRPRLIEILNHGLRHPLTLVAAPAGYGKTMLASSFLQGCTLPWAWLSLDEHDNDLRLFLEYLLAALDSMFPSAFQRTQLMLAGAMLPPVSAIADSLINELVELERPFILVLDDMHIIHLEESNSFTLALDERGHWFRYHHLFQAFLRSRLARDFDALAIAALHRRASAWYASHGDIEAALQHALAGGDTPGAVQLVAQHRHELLNTEQLPRLERWLQLFLAATLEQYPELLLAKVWVAELVRGGPAHVILYMLDQAQASLTRGVAPPGRARQLQGEIDVLRCMEKTFAADDPQGAITLATRALELMPHAWRLARVQAWLHLAGAFQASGQLDRAYALFAAAQQEEAVISPTPRLRLLAAPCFIYWMAADLARMLQAAQQTVAVSQATDDSRESLGWGHYFLASVYYQRNDLAAAEMHANIVQELRHACAHYAVVQSAMVLVGIHQARRAPDAARTVFERLKNFLAEMPNVVLQLFVDAFEAELAVLQGDLERASSWALTAGAQVPLGVMTYHYAPQLTLPKVLLALNTPASRQQATAALERLHTFVTTTHNTRFTIDVLALQALCHAAEGDEPAALLALEQAVTLAQPGGFIRAFVDLGPAMHGLLARLAQRGHATGYLQQLLDAFPTSAPAPHPSSSRLIAPTDLVEPLTRRELEILALLAQRFSAREIAQRLVISERTVKRHTANIYLKLAVNGRTAAVAAAMALGLLPAPR